MPGHGSSPLARGTRGSLWEPNTQLRFIPARAGNTEVRSAAVGEQPVHPRSRGEHQPPAVVSTTATGSSPLARGTPTAGGSLDHGNRFIPARAGNTPGGRRRRCGCPVHPRSRGEHLWTSPMGGSIPGSSPLARGTPCAEHRGPVRDRFIPARAGNTGLSSPASTPSSVHPRSRGEHGAMWTRMGSATGSSPLARGTRRGLECAVDQARFIPARAGNTPARSR